MALSNQDIKKHLKTGKLRISPRISDDQIGAASVDLTLDGIFWKFRKSYIGSRVDLSKTGFGQATEKLVADSITLAPGEMCLGITVEKLTLGPDLIGTLEGRSRYARMGLAVHVTSALVQPGSDNHQVLEIVNLAPFSVTIRKGMRISQVVFDKLLTKTTKPYAKFGKIARKQ